MQKVTRYLWIMVLGLCCFFHFVKLASAQYSGTLPLLDGKIDEIPKTLSHSVASVETTPLKLSSPPGEDSPEDIQTEDLDTVDPSEYASDRKIYSEYQNDFREILRFLSGLKKGLEIGMRMDVMAAKRSTLQLINYDFKAKYFYGPESHYESYQTIQTIEAEISQFVRFWQTSKKYKQVYTSSMVAESEEDHVLKVKARKIYNLIHQLESLSRDNQVQ